VLVRLEDNMQHSCEQFQIGGTLRFFFSSRCLMTLLNVS